MASSWLNFFREKKKKKKTRRNWASYVTLSWRTNVRASKRILAMYWPGSWRTGEPAQGHVAGSISASFFFSAKKIEPATWRWASYEALSQLRGIEPATWHWASKVALSFELARRQWASKVALSFIIYIYIYTPMQSQPCNILDLGKTNFFEGDTYLWAGAGMWNLTFEWNGTPRFLSQVVSWHPGDCFWIPQTDGVEGRSGIMRPSGWWFGTVFIFLYIGNFIIPTDELIFFRGVGIPPTSHG